MFIFRVWHNFTETYTAYKVSVGLQNQIEKHTDKKDAHPSIFRSAEASRELEYSLIRNKWDKTRPRMTDY